MSLCPCTSLLLSRCRWIPPQRGHRAGMGGKQDRGRPRWRKLQNCAEFLPSTRSPCYRADVSPARNWEKARAWVGGVSGGWHKLHLPRDRWWDSWRWGGELGWAWMRPTATPSLPAPAQRIEFTCLSPQGIVSGHGLWLVGFLAPPTPPAAPKRLAVCPTHNKYFFENLN